MALKEQLGVRISKEMNVDGLKITADPFDGPGPKLRRVGLIEPEMREMLSRVLKPGMTLFDVGAYIGQFCLAASNLCEGQLDVIAFEPTPNVFAQLQRNAKTNHFPKLTCIQAALSDKPGIAKFFFFPESYDQNSLRPLADSAAQCIDVKVETLDSVCSQRSISRLDFLKIDVEGNELAVFRGAQQSLNRFRPLVMFEISRHQSAYGYGGAEIKQFLEQSGYELYRMGQLPYRLYTPSTDVIDNATSHFNVLAVPRESEAKASLTV
jgi:FkbM family methyltransferase